MKKQELLRIIKIKIEKTPKTARAGLREFLIYIDKESIAKS